MRRRLIGQSDPGWNCGCHQNLLLPCSPLSVCVIYKGRKQMWVIKSRKKRLHTQMKLCIYSNMWQERLFGVILLTWRGELLRVSVKSKQACFIFCAFIFKWVCSFMASKILQLFPAQKTTKPPGFLYQSVQTNTSGVVSGVNYHTSYKTRVSVFLGGGEVWKINLTWSQQLIL